MKYKLTIDDLIAKIKEHGCGFYYAVDTMIDFTLDSDDIDRDLIKMVKKNRAKLRVDIFVDGLPEVGWHGSIEELIKPEYHAFFTVDGRQSAEYMLLLLKLAGIEKITIKTSDSEEE